MYTLNPKTLGSLGPKASKYESFEGKGLSLMPEWRGLGFLRFSLGEFRDFWGFFGSFA